MLLLAASVLLAQAASASPAPYTSWNSITLGSPASTLRSALGDPLRITLFKNGTRRVARYWLPGSDSTYVLVVEERGYVTGLDIFTDAAPTGVLDNVPADPLGVRLGDTFGDAQAMTPQLHRDVDDNGAPILIGRVTPTVGVAYSFQNNRVQRMSWATSAADGAPELAPLALPAGDATSTAIADAQKNETDGVAWEYRFLAFQSCADGASWKLQSQSLLHEDGRSYDELHVYCPPTKVERDFYFDVSSYFGKL